MKKQVKANPRRKPITVTKKQAAAMVKYVERVDFVGSQMANRLYALKTDSRLDSYTRDALATLQRRWDSVCLTRLTNPISMMEKERELFPNG